MEIIEEKDAIWTVKLDSKDRNAIWFLWTYYMKKENKPGSIISSALKMRSDEDKYGKTFIPIIFDMLHKFRLAQIGYMW